MNQVKKLNSSINVLNSWKFPDDSAHRYKCTPVNVKLIKSIYAYN